MSHPLGAITYHRAPKFTLTRSYYKGIWVRYVTGYTVEWHGNRVDLVNHVIPGFVAHVEFEPRFVAWSSNSYTLDFLVSGWWYTQAPDTHEYVFPFPIGLGTAWSPDNALYVRLDWFAYDSNDYHILPQRNQSYWLPENPT